MDYQDEIQEALAESDEVDCPRCGSTDDLVQGKNPNRMYCAHCGVPRAEAKVKESSPDQDGNKTVTVKVVILAVKAAKGEKKPEKEKKPWGFFRAFLAGMAITMGTTLIFFFLGNLAGIDDNGVGVSLLLAWAVTGTVMSLMAGFVLGGVNQSAW